MDPRKRARQKAIDRLGLTLPITEEDVKQAYRRRAQKAHPDHGGSAEEFIEIQTAFEEALGFAKKSGKRLPWLGSQLPIYIAQETTLEFLNEWGGRYVVHQLEWLENTVGEDFSVMGDRLVEIDLSGLGLEDDDFVRWGVQVETLPFLEKLNLSGTKVTLNGLKKMPMMNSLQELNLSDTSTSQLDRLQFAKQRNIPNAIGINLTGKLISFFGRI